MMERGRQNIFSPQIVWILNNFNGFYGLWKAFRCINLGAYKEKIDRPIVTLPTCMSLHEMHNVMIWKEELKMKKIVMFYG